MNPRFSHLKKGQCEKGFSLIEFIGVLVILSLIAAAAGPTFIKRVDYAAKTAEKEALASFTNALVTGCIANIAIPGASNMPTTIAQAMNCNVSQVTVNPRGFSRLFIVDPAVVISGNTINSSPPALPYSQGAAGISGLPTNVRMVMLSTIARALPAITPSASEFDGIWNAADDTIPAVLSSWGGRGEDLQIQRVDFTRLFQKVVLKNIDPVLTNAPSPNPNLGYYQFETYGVVYVQPNSQFSAYYFDGTLLTLYVAGGVTPDTRQIVHTDISFVYQNHKWSRRLQGSDDSVGGFGDLASEFLKPPAPTNPKFAATQQAVLNLMYSFLWTYDNWAYGNSNAVPSIPIYQSGSAVANYPSWSLVNEAQTHLADFTNNLIQ